MDLPHIDTALGWRGRTVHDEAGERIGTLEQLYLDAEDDRPAWAGVRTGLLGLRESFVPLAGAREDGDALVVPYAKDHVRDAPSVDPDAALEPDEEAALRRHYGLDGAQPAEEPGATATATTRTDDPVPPDRPADRADAVHDTDRTAAARDTDRADAVSDTDRTDAPRDTDRADAVSDTDRTDAPRNTDPADAVSDTDRTDAPRDTDPAGAVSDTDRTDAPRDTGGPVEMIRSEEEVLAGTTQPRPTERVRLRKVKVTENVTRTVPVRREEVRLEHEPPPEGRIESVEDVEDERPA